MIFGFALGTILGSFVKALADRSLSRKSFGGRSYCPKCQHKLAWYDLLPIISFLLLRGKCRYCHKKIGVEYLWVEIAMGILIGFLFWQSFQSPTTLLDLLIKTFFIVVLAVVFLTDLKKMLIPDRIMKPAIIIALILLIIKAVLTTNTEPLYMGILVALLIGGFFYSLIVITKGKGMGGGDVKLGAFMGLLLGFPQALFALVLAFLTGAIFSVGLIILGKKHFGQTIPFGPFLVLGSLIMLFWGPEIINWYLNIGT
jgi:prepilin signal peptidase PulO-like enzyme (type II secretory pathway)